MTVQLNDAQLVLLSHAAQNDAGAVLPLPASLKDDENRTAKDLKSLLRRKLIEEREVAPGAETWRSDGDLVFGLFLTDTGCEAIGVVSGEETLVVDAEESTASNDDDPATEPGNSSKASGPGDSAQCGAASHPRPGSKIAAVIALLERDQGATLDEMVKATGWLPHTTRAALTGLRKKGHMIEKAKRDNVTCYHIAAEA